MKEITVLQIIIFLNSENYKNALNFKKNRDKSRYFSYFNLKMRKKSKKCKKEEAWF